MSKKKGKVKKKKSRKTQTGAKVAQKKKSRLKGWQLQLVVFMGFGLIVAAIAFLPQRSSKTNYRSATRNTQPRRAYTPPHRPRRPKPFNVMKVIEYQTNMKKKTHKVMHDVAKGHPLAEKIVAFFKKNTYVTMPMDHRATRFISRGSAVGIEEKIKNPHTVELVFQPAHHQRYYPGKFYYDWKGNVIRIFGGITNPKWAGIMLIHEMQHAYEIKTGIENPRLVSEVMKGEARTHYTECELILRHWPTQFQRVISSQTKTLSRKMMREIAEAFPEVKRSREGGQITAALMTCKLFKEYQQRNLKLVDAYIKLRKYFVKSEREYRKRHRHISQSLSPKPI